MRSERDDIDMAREDELDRHYEEGPEDFNGSSEITEEMLHVIATSIVLEAPFPKKEKD